MRYQHAAKFSIVACFSHDPKENSRCRADIVLLEVDGANDASHPSYGEIAQR